MNQPNDNARTIAELREQIAVLEERTKKAEAFKQWVHQYLDTHGVPHHPAGSHGAAGCRIGDRMDWLMAQLKELETSTAHLNLLLIRKNEALSLFASPAMWCQSDIWNGDGGGAYRNPIEFAKREMEADEPC